MKIHSGSIDESSALKLMINDAKYSPTLIE
jgi:hypothetical protein